MIVLDDLGFADLGCYGSAIATPNIDRLAGHGLRYNRFHVTALCSPTRACLMTGRNHHAVGMGKLSDTPMPFPGYSGRLPRSVATLPELLRRGGYNTFAVGKWHLTPRFEEGVAGPFDRWPLGLGFERYYGFLRGYTSQWTPQLVRDNSFVEPPATPDQGYHLTEDLATQAVRFIQDQQQAAPSKPFFLHLATGAMHVPHHVASEWVDSYSGQFAAGWDTYREQIFLSQQEKGVIPSATTLTARPSWVQAWSGLPAEERQLFARMMEVYAAFLTHTDAQIGRVVNRLSDLGVLDQTLIMVLSDNGTDPAGGPHGLLNVLAGDNRIPSMMSRIHELGGPNSCNAYPWGWAWAGNTPFKLWKWYTWLGGVRVPLIVHWPDRLAESSRGEVRSQFCHAIDLMPTILEASQIDLPNVFNGIVQEPLDGASILATFDDADRPDSRNTQYFEMAGSRAIYHNGWKATTNHVQFGDTAIEGSHDFDQDTWSLFNLEEDFSEAHDVSEAHPRLLRQLIHLWWSEAGRNRVLPLFDGEEAPPDPSTHAPRKCVWLPNGGPMDTRAPFVDGFRFTADIDVTEIPSAGVIAAQREVHSGCYSPIGWTCYVLDGRVTVIFFDGHAHYRIVSQNSLSAGEHVVEVSYEPEAGERNGLIHFALDGQKATSVPGPASAALPLRQWVTGRVLVGQEFTIPLSDTRSPFPFNGQLRRVTFEVPEEDPFRR